MQTVRKIIMEEQTKKILGVLISKAHRIVEYKFDEHVRQIGLNFQLTRANGDEYLIEFGLPEEKELDAIVLTLRMFTQPNESFSFPNIHGLLRDPGLSNEF